MSSSPPVSFLGGISSAFQNFYDEIFPEEVVIGEPETFRSGDTSLQSSLSSYRMSTLAFTPLIKPDSNQEKLEQCVTAVISKLLSQNGELLAEEGIFRISGSQAKIIALKRDLPSELETNDPLLLAGFLKSVFSTNGNRPGQQIEFVPTIFSREDFDQLTQEIQNNPKEVKRQLYFLFSKQNECVRLFILLLKRTSQLQEFNKMGVENLALLMNPFLTSHFSLEEQFTCSSVLASFIIEHAEEIFPETLPIFNKLAHPVLKRVEDTIHAAIDMLSANEGQLLKTKHIFALGVSKSEIRRLQNSLPDSFKPGEEDPCLLACLLKTLFHQKAKDDEFRRVRFLPDGFTFRHFNIVLNFLEKDPAYVKDLFRKLFSTQNESVKKFILLLNQTAHLQEFNDMSADKLARVINPLLYSHFSEDEIVQCTHTLARFIIEHAEEIFSEQIPRSEPLEQTDKGEIIFIEPIDQNLDLWLDYNKWFMTRIKDGEILNSVDANEYIEPSEALSRISRLFLLIPSIRSYTNIKESLLENIDRLQLNMIDLKCLDEEDRLMHDQIAAMKKTLEVFQANIESKKNLGPQLNRELNDLIETKHCDITEALRILESKYQQIEASLKQIGLDLWRSTMTLVDPNEQDPKKQQKLMSQSRVSAHNWAEIFQHWGKLLRWENHKDLGYGPIEVAKEAGFPEDTEITFLAKQVIRSLDYYLFNLGYSSDIRLNIYKQFQQSSMGLFDPTTVTEDLIVQAGQSSEDVSQSDEDRLSELKTRYEAYCLAYWRSGWTGIPLITPGSKLDTNGFAAYVASKSFEEGVSFKKVLLLTLDLKTSTVASHYLFQFKNPFSKQHEIYYYRAIHQFELLDTSFEALPPGRFPDLEKLRGLPKFILQRPEDSPKSKESEKEKIES
ncbi:MAG: hypothetical protein Q8L98_01330 [Chlamydiales bacterium]|nr:hypothetical protein [Chlamydiales bacterium]